MALSRLITGLILIATCPLIRAGDAVTIDAAGNTTFTGSISAVGQITAPNVLQGSTGVNVTAAATLTTAAFGAWHWITGTTADYTITLPTAVGHAGKVIGLRVKDASVATKVYTLAAASGQTIDGASTVSMTAATTLMVMSDGTGWAKINSAAAASTASGSRKTLYVATLTGSTSSNVIGSLINGANRLEQGSLIVPGNTLAPGRSIRVTVSYKIGAVTGGNTAGNINVKFGSLNGALTTPAVVDGTGEGVYEAILTCRTAGAAGQCVKSSSMRGVITSSGGVSSYNRDKASVSAFTIDTSAPLPIEVLGSITLVGGAMFMEIGTVTVEVIPEP